MDLFAGLTQGLDSTRVLISPIHRVAYANDASYFRLIPQAVVQPNSLNEIKFLFNFAQRHSIPMTFRAAGTSLSGQAVTNGILVDISKHWGRFTVEYGGNIIRSEPGVIGGFLNNVLKSHRRRIGPDPASIDACMLGGILANNSSGMCCGVTENAYRTLHSMTFVLPNGFVLDSGEKDADQIFENDQPHIARGLLDLKKRILHSPASRTRAGVGDESLAARIRRRYQMKNNNGYLLNAFLDFDSPLEILTHLLIGSEGTLGFIAEAALHTLPEYSHKYTGQLYFRNIQDAASAIHPLRLSGARAAEIMDRASLRSVDKLPGAPGILHSLPGGAAAILVEYQAEDFESISRYKQQAGRVVRELRLLHEAEFTDEPTEQAALWKLRKGIIPTVGAMRPPATTLLTEDVVFPVSNLADGVTDLQKLFAEHGYSEGVIFGHAKDGNLHFLISQSFNTDMDVRQFAGFMDDLVHVVSGKYDGALKAEHGTGRNTAPFVETEWGSEAYAIMQDLKSLLDPYGMLNPGVVINPDPQAHVTHVKRMAEVAPEVDQCIECGFCESKCPSGRLTLTPRQRIVVRREISGLGISASDPSLLTSLLEDYGYEGNDTCALDGLCATACPVGINTGELTRNLRTEAVKGEKPAIWIADHFAFVEKTVGLAVRVGHFAEGIIGVGGVNFLPTLVEKLLGSRVPKWNDSIPLPSPRGPWRQSGSGNEYIYFPSCISRQLGKPRTIFKDPTYDIRSLPDTLVTISQRAGLNLSIPENILGACCGLPFASKGYQKTYRSVLSKTVGLMWDWSAQGRYSIVIDTSSCTHSLHDCQNDLTEDDRQLWKKLTFIDIVDYIHDLILPRLDIHPINEDVVLHPNCSARKLGLEVKMSAIAGQCARSVSVPLNLGCCAFAGDRGLLIPELTQSATSVEAAEVLAGNHQGHFSSNIPCEIGMRMATGKNYRSIAYLVEAASR